MIERSRVRVPAGAAVEFSSPGSTFCADSYFGIRSTPVLRSSMTERRLKKEEKEDKEEKRDDDDDRFYIALFSALEQTHCARM